MNKKITFIISGLRGGGAEGVCVTIVNYLIDLGIDIDLVVLNLNDAVYDKDLSPKVNLINLKVKHARYSFIPIWLYLLRNNPKTILSFNRQISVIVTLIRKFSNFKFKLISRNIIFLSIAESNKKGIWHAYIAKYLIKSFYKLSDVIISQSSAMKDDLIKYLDISEKKIIVINNPICEKVVQFKNHNKLGAYVEKNDYLLCVGRLEEQKAFHYSIQAFAIVSKKFPNLRLKIIGKGSLENDLKKQAEDLGVLNKIDFEGFQENIISYYLHAKATLLTSLYEGFPNVLIESIALGTPVVSFDCPSGPSEIIEHGVNGYLVEHKDINSFVKYLHMILQSPLPSDLIIKTSEKYSIENIMKEYTKVLF